MLENIQYAAISFGIVIALVLIFSFNKVKRAILSLFGGSIDLPEAGGILFASLFTHMILKEGNRTHEWHIYNELYIFFVAGAAMTGLGLGKVLGAIKDIKSINSGNSSITDTQINKREIKNDNESEAPK